MKLFVRLQKDVEAGQRTPGLPDAWPVEVQEVSDDETNPSGVLVMKSAAELEAYKAKLQPEYDAWRAALDLPDLRQGAFEAIDARTVELIAAGFGFSNKTFSLSPSAQSTWQGLYSVKDEPMLKYPVKVNTVDDEDTVELEDAAHVRDFYLTAVLTYRGHLDSGTKLKDAVRAASTVDEVKAVQDTR